ncbi:MAG: hypothetical protein L3J83_00055 [Proteobacteria bacterium]|nr:hypothetical protein [Pseudomonadota bacterium]
MYIGKTMEASFTEKILHGGMNIDVVSKSKLKTISVIEICFKHDLTLVNFNSAGLTKNNVNSFIFSCSHEISRNWATSIINNIHSYDGIFYPCNHDNQYYSIALFDRSHLDYTVKSLGRLTDDLFVDVELFLYQHGVGII